MLERRSFMATALKAIAVGVVATPALTLAQGEPVDQLPAAYPASTGAPRTRGPARGSRSVTADADEPGTIRSSGSPASRGPARSARVETASVDDDPGANRSRGPSTRGRRRSGTTEEIGAKAASLR